MDPEKIIEIEEKQALAADERRISNAFFFGQFVLLHILLKLKGTMDAGNIWKFIEKKFKDIGVNNPTFVTQIKKIQIKSSQYFRDTMETKFYKGD